MQEGARAEQPVRVGCLRTQQQRRAVDRPGREHVVLRLHARARAARTQPGGIEPVDLEGLDAVADDREARGARAREQHRTGLERGREGGHQHRLLGVGRAAHAAVADVEAAAHVAPDPRHGDAQPGGAAAQQAVVLVGRHAPRADRQAPLRLLEPRQERLGGEVGQAVVRAPPCQGGLRRAEARGPVHRRRAADAAALHDVDGLVLGLARGRFLVELRVGVGFAHLEVARALERPFLDHHHAQAGARQDLGGDPTPGAAADDRDVAFDARRVARGTRVEDLPAARQARRDRIREAAHFGRGKRRAIGDDT